MKKRKNSQKTKTIGSKIFRIKPIYLFALVFGFFGVATLAYSAAAPRAPRAIDAATFNIIAAQPTPWGKQVNELKYYDGKIYAGYGDWNTNTGPVHMLAYNIATGLVEDEFTFGSEASHWMNEQNGKLYVPAVDQKGSDLAIKANGQWRSLANLGSDHLFSAIELNGKIYTAGQKGGIATIWSSADNGESWQIELQDTSSGRFPFIAELNGKLYTQAKKSYSYDPTTEKWSEISSIWGGFTMGYKAEKFKNVLVGLLWYPFGEDPANSLYTYNGVEHASLCDCNDFTIEGDYLYALRSDGVVLKTADLVNWKEIAQSSGGGKTTKARSVEVHDNVVYIGTSDSKLQIVQLGGDSTGNGGKGR